MERAVHDGSPKQTLGVEGWIFKHLIPQTQLNSPQCKVVIVGGGLAGLYAANCLASNGCSIRVYERLTDPRTPQPPAGRSINMTLSARGLQALAGIGLNERIADYTIPLKGRMVHCSNSKIIFQAYGKNENEVLLSIRRNDLAKALVQGAERFPNVKLFFRHTFLRLEKQIQRILVRDEQQHREFYDDYDILIGADGTFSLVRQQMQRRERANYQQEFLEWGFKELTLHAKSQGSYHLEKNSLHVWPRRKFLLLALPNLDGTFTITVVLPFQGEPSFSSLKGESKVMKFFDAEFPDVARLLSRPYRFVEKTVAYFVTTHTTPWHSGNIVLIGDACHTVVPFLGQGMNAAFEDCITLARVLSIHRDNTAENVFSEYEALRRPNTDALADLSIQNFTYLRDMSRPRLAAERGKIELAINTFYPRAWTPLYSMISHTTIPYAEALKRFQKQRRRARLLGLDLAISGMAVGLAFIQIGLDWIRHTRVSIASQGVADRTRYYPVGDNALRHTSR